MKKILIDTDMGYDDILAISMLLISTKVEIAGISLVDGVCRKKQGFYNLCRILEFYKKKIPVFYPSYNSISQNFATFPKRDTQRAEKLVLLGRLNMPYIRSSKKTVGNFKSLFKSIRPKEKLIILALGPLTNVARLIKNYPEKIEQVILMGGGLYKGNVPPKYLSEYNVSIDPPAANQVFNCDIPVVMVGIDAAIFVPAIESFKKAISKINSDTKGGKTIKEIILRNNGDFDYFYDPLAAAILLDSNIATENTKCLIKVSELGQTILYAGYKENISAILKVNKEKFYNLLRQIIL